MRCLNVMNVKYYRIHSEILVKLCSPSANLQRMGYDHLPSSVLNSGMIYLPILKIYVIWMLQNSNIYSITRVVHVIQIILKAICEFYCFWIYPFVFLYYLTHYFNSYYFTCLVHICTVYNFARVVY